jgi:hypothetical protein
LLFGLGGWGGGGVGFSGNPGPRSETWGTRICGEGGFGFFGEGEGAAVAYPCAVGMVGGVEVEGGERLAGALNGLDVAGLEGEGDGLDEVDSGVFEVVVDEERNGDEAGGGGVV